MTRSEDEIVAEMKTRYGNAKATVVACGVANMTWRAHIEPAHHRFTDAEMAYMNIATTLVVLPHCTATEVNWRRVREVLLDPERIVLPGRSAADALGADLDEIFAELDDEIARSSRRHAFAAAAWADMMCRGWWGMPDFPKQVDGLIEKFLPPSWAGTPDELRSALLRAPLSVSLDLWTEIVGGNGFGWLEPRED